MKPTPILLILSLGVLAALAADSPPRITGASFPLWAYGVRTPPEPGQKANPQTPGTRRLRPNEPEAEQTRLRQVEGSKAQYSKLDIRDAQNVIDWFPEDHPPMPKVIKHGPAGMGPQAWGCALCHLPNGKGRPENAPVSGLPVAYFVRQLEDFRDGKRVSADPRKPNTPTMAVLSKGMTAEEMKEAAEYFGAIKWTPWIRVIETDLVPPTRIAGNLHLPTSPQRTEPIAGRIIEVPEDEEQSETLRNPRSGFIAYVPVGSLKHGENLVKTGGMTVADGKIVPGKTLACATCHGPDLMGLADIPGIAGRSPSYLVRQLYEFQQGHRRGASAPLMQPAVANLNDEDLVGIGAYLASLVPPPAPAAK